MGTGNYAKARPDLDADDLDLLDHARNVPGALMNAATAGWDMACRLLGECRHGAPIDREIGDMVATTESGPNWTGAKQFAYVRYDPDVTRAGLDALGLTKVSEEHVQLMDSVKFIPEIQRVGKAYAAAHFDINHFRGFI